MAQQTAAQQAAAQQTAARRVLVIDDEEAIITIVKVSLEITASWQVVTTSSSADSVEVAIKAQPDAILLDVSMPNIDGTEVLKSLQAEEKTRHIPVIFLTAKARKSDQQKLKALGAAGVIIKPFNPETIASQMKTILGWEN